ncbi:hypothetical protein V8E36_001936 [Tilletia maclaganii]
MSSSVGRDTRGSDWQAVLRPYVESWGSHAQSPTPAWALSALCRSSKEMRAALASGFQCSFAVAGPLSVARGSSSSRSSSVAPPTAATRAYPGSGIVAAARAPLSALPPFYQLVGFSAIFGGAGYIVAQGDSLNGSGVMSAWTMLYLCFRFIPSLRLTAPGEPLPLVLSLSTMAVGSTYAAHYFSRTSWRGAVPFTPPSPVSRSVTHKTAHRSPADASGGLFSAPDANLRSQMVDATSTAESSSSHSSRGVISWARFLVPPGRDIGLSRPSSVLWGRLESRPVNRCSDFRRRDGPHGLK